MQKFTKIEISRIIIELDKAATELNRLANEPNDRDFSKMYRLRSEQYADISRRLCLALKEGSKRIEIK